MGLKVLCLLSFKKVSVEKNSTAVFRAAINIPGLFHGFNTPYYYYENS